MSFPDDSQSSPWKAASLFRQHLQTSRHNIIDRFDRRVFGPLDFTIVGPLDNKSSMISVEPRRGMAYLALKKKKKKMKPCDKRTQEVYDMKSRNLQKNLTRFSGLFIDYLLIS